MNNQVEGLRGEEVLIPGGGEEVEPREVGRISKVVEDGVSFNDLCLGPEADDDVVDGAGHKGKGEGDGLEIRRSLFISGKTSDKAGPL